MASVGGSASPCPRPGTLYRQAESIFGEAPKPDALRNGHVVKGGPEVPGRVFSGWAEKAAQPTPIVPVTR